MQRNDHWPDDYEPDPVRSRPGSRRNSASSRRNSIKKERDKKKSPLNTAPSSCTSTPKKVVKPPNLDLVVTGKQLLKKSDRANSLPGYHRRPSTDSNKLKKTHEPAKKTATNSQSSKSLETSLEDDMSLDLSQVSDFEDTSSKYGIKTKFSALATSTPKPRVQKPRSASLHSTLMQKECRKKEAPRESQDSLCKSASVSSHYRTAASTELDYSSVSPEYSQSSVEMSPRQSRLDLITPQSQDIHVSSCCISSWQDSEIDHTKVQDYRPDGEWNNFWANYNNSVSEVPMKSYYDQCPTPYRTENIDLADLDFSAEGSRKRSPEAINNLNCIIRNEGLHLTPRETQNIIKCAHILGNVLTKAIERRSREKENDKVQEINMDKDEEKELRKKSMTLDLKEAVLPLEVKEEKKSETVTTQTDISLPNTKSAPRIFENILRQLSRTSIDEPVIKTVEKPNEVTDEKSEAIKDVKIDENKSTEKIIEENEAK